MKVLRRRARSVLVAVPVVTLALAGCGQDVVTAEDGPTAEGFDAFELSGEVGAPPEVEWDRRMEAGDAETEVLVEGDGAALATGDQAIVSYTVLNGFSREQTITSYEEEPTGQLLTVGEPNPQAQDVNQFAASIAGENLPDGVTVGSRVGIVAGGEDLLGDAGASFGIGNEDSVLMVVDVLSSVQEKPDGSQRPAPAWAPEIVHEKGEPVRLGFAGTPEPTDALQQAVLIEGDGPAVEKGQTIAANYLGQVYGGAKPFDESYTAAPVGFGIGIGAVVKGWDQALVGQKVGSRVVLAIPPALGYGKTGRPEAGIKPTDTLYFVVDILGAG